MRTRCQIHSVNVWVGHSQLIKETIDLKADTKAGEVRDIMWYRWMYP